MKTNPSFIDADTKSIETQLVLTRLGILPQRIFINPLSVNLDHVFNVGIQSS